MTSQFLTFAIRDAAYAIPLASVREVVGCRSIARVPNAGECVRGVMNLRGNVVPVVDFGRRISGGDTPLSGSTCVVLMDSKVDGGDAIVAGLVEEIHAVLDLDASAIASPPDFGTPADPRLLRGVTPGANDQLIYVLDPDDLFAGIA
jgi:purine-binding chemotaxis protein CheW